MKKMNNLIIIVVVIFLTGCQTAEFEENTFESSQIESVLNLEGQAQRNAYTLLDKELKHRIWVEKLNQAKPNLNAEQQRVVEELLTIINPNFFSVPVSQNDVTNPKIEKWFLNAKKHFNKGEFIDVFVTLNNRGPGTDPIGNDGCSCNHDEDYCRWKTDCTGSGCQGSGWGCGLLWNSPCNGTCQ